MCWHYLKYAINCKQLFHNFFFDGRQNTNYSDNFFCFHFKSLFFPLRFCSFGCSGRLWADLVFTSGQLFVVGRNERSRQRQIRPRSPSDWRRVSLPIRRLLRQERDHQRQRFTRELLFSRTAVRDAKRRRSVSAFPASTIDRRSVLLGQQQ